MRWMLGMRSGGGDMIDDNDMIMALFVTMLHFCGDIHWWCRRAKRWVGLWRFDERGVLVIWVLEAAFSIQVN
jgi:hypothetical protein